MIYRLLIVLCIPLALDLFNCYLELKRNRRVKGASGLPLIPLFMSAVFIFNSPLEHFYQKLLLLILAVMVHTLVAIIIPYLDYKRLRRKRDGIELRGEI